MLRYNIYLGVRPVHCIACIPNLIRNIVFNLYRLPVVLSFQHFDIEVFSVFTAKESRDDAV